MGVLSLCYLRVVLYTSNELVLYLSGSTSNELVLYLRVLSGSIVYF